jgi:hypothetical protein
MLKRTDPWSSLAAASILLANASILLSGCRPEERDPPVERRVQALSHTELAFRWAPIIHQDVDKNLGHGANGLRGKSDYLTAFDYDGDLVTSNNWDNLPNARITPVVYFSVTESVDRYYLYYLLYHPRDWVSACRADNEHENDAEGYMFIIKKDGTTFGLLEGAVSQVHGGLESYSNVSYLTNPKGSMFSMQFETLPHESFDRVRAYVQPQGHSSHLCGSRVTNCFRINDDGVRYEPDLSAADEVPVPIPDGQLFTARYTLVDMTALRTNAMFSSRFNPDVFVNARSFRGAPAGGAAAACGPSPNVRSMERTPSGPGRSALSARTLPVSPAATTPSARRRRPQASTPATRSRSWRPRARSVHTMFV